MRFNSVRLLMISFAMVSSRVSCSRIIRRNLLILIIALQRMDRLRRNEVQASKRGHSFTPLLNSVFIQASLVTLYNYVCMFPDFQFLYVRRGGDELLGNNVK